MKGRNYNLLYYNLITSNRYSILQLKLLMLWSVGGGYNKQQRISRTMVLKTYLDNMIHTYISLYDNPYYLYDIGYT